MLAYIAVLILVFPLATQADCIGTLTDLPASKWRDAASKPELNMLKKHTGPITKITVHYTAVKKNPKSSIERKLKGLFRFSRHDTNKIKKNLWGDVPYSYYIDMHGKMAEGRSTVFQPDTNTTYNPDGHVTIVVEGDDSDDLSPQQKDKLFATIQALQNKYNIPTSEVGQHNHYCSTTCPGPAITAAIKEYKKTKANYRPNRTACGPRKGTVSGFLDDDEPPANR